MFPGLDTRVSGCNPLTATANPAGGSKVIAIVDAFNDPNAATDLAKFSAQFGLPAANFSKVFASGTKPPQDPTGGWELEESLDIEWAHAMAPSARIILVKAASNSLSNLLTAETKAATLVALRVAVRFPTVGAAENSPAKPASTLTLSSPA